ncbi:MAG: di-heme-cytochrome C peroxidase [Planctomycetaceae bacterium]|nr:di-heme-cytochrome C peroxidase [Planctomycetaceae bacterium]
MNHIPGIVILTAAIVCVPRAPADDMIFLDQGWNADQREQFYFTPQGSHLIPYSWFLALEQAGSDALFRSADNMRRYEILPAPVSDLNPDGLPVGFVKGTVDPDSPDLRSFQGEFTGANKADEAKKAIQSLARDARRYRIKSAFLGAEFDRKRYPRRESSAWFGLTCAACHTQEMEFDGHTIRIDGGSTQADLESFLKDLGLALAATHKSPKKLERFAQRVGRSGAIDDLKQEVMLIADAVNRLVERNRADSPYGFARLDAFGAILNAVCETALDEPRNHLTSNAPVSYPALWNVPALGFVQWIANSQWAESRNTGEVLGVFGHYSLQPGKEQFSSTIRLRNLITIEHDLLTKLQAPQWPEDLFGKLDEQKVEAGRKLFKQNCVACHPVRGENGKFALNEYGRIPVSTTPPQVIGTDSQQLANLSPQHMAHTGPLSELLDGKEQVPRTDLLSLVVAQILRNRAAKEHVDLAKYLPNPEDPNPPGPGYIQRPLEGIWATAPFFHNGSVPSLYETLLPSAKRSKTFFVGTREFDPVKVGFVTEANGRGSVFQVFDEAGKAVTGNSNAGHEGHTAEHGFTQTLDNGEWRDFTEDEIFALIEYMKWLPGPGTSAPPATVEEIPDGEQAAIDSVVDLTARRMRAMYAEGGLRRGVHPKDHGCVKATFQVLPEIGEDHAVGVFQPGAAYEAYVRFSNASVVPGADSSADADGKVAHGSRGMAIKLMGVAGDSLLPEQGPLTQDFVMVNQPAFAFANVHDYQIISQLLLDPDVKDKAAEFVRRLAAMDDPAAKQRAMRTATIAGRIASPAVDGDRGAFEQPPASPVDNSYFSAAPFLLGPDQVMKFRVRPLSRSLERPDVADPDYLRKAMQERLRGEKIVFAFELQVRSVQDVISAVDIEDASTEWDDEFTQVATLVIEPQEPVADDLCEKLFFTPWHGLQAHRPLGGINRLRRAVYLASGKLRGAMAEPAGFVD